MLQGGDGVKYFGRDSQTFRSFRPLQEEHTIPQAEERRNKELSEIKAYIDSGYSASLSKDMGPATSFPVFEEDTRVHRGRGGSGQVHLGKYPQNATSVSKSSRMRQSCCIRAHLDKGKGKGKDTHR